VRRSGVGIAIHNPGLQRCDASGIIPSAPCDTFRKFFPDRKTESF
jgi:hypothetical protein